MPGDDDLAIGALIPHHGESILLDRVVAHDSESTTARVIVGSQRWLRREDGSVAAWLAIEYMAQCAAAHERLLGRTGTGDPSIGFLAKITRLRFRTSSFQGGEHLMVRVRRIRGRPGLGALSHSCEIFRESDDPQAEPIAEGRLSTVLERSSD